MGEAYRARDTRLDRDVAIKVLPAHVQDHPQLKERFQREARVISRLSDPHICTLHDVGSEDGVAYLVMELLEGETLALRIEKGPLPLEEVIRYGAEIARALEHAHRYGIVHRDLKPGNVMITKNGAKILDFGLARSTSPAADATAEMALTQTGAVVGTMQYMSPEQLEGREADTRSDIFALGLILYEMATGNRAFAELDLPRMWPPALDRLVRLCLRKDRDERWQNALDLALQLEAISDQPEAPKRIGNRWLIPLAIAIALAGLAGGLLLRRGRAPAAPVRFEIFPPDGAFVPLHRQNSLLALSPDGTKLALVLAVDRTTRLWVRSLDSGEAKFINGTDGATSPFFSPESRFLGFQANGRLMKVDLAGGAPQTICRIATTGATADWGADGTILFTENAGAPGIVKRVPSAGGEPVEILSIPTQQQPRDVMRYRHPQFLPDRKHFIVWRRGPGLTGRGIEVRSLDRSVSKEVVAEAAKPRFVAPDLILNVREGTLLARRFDAGDLEVRGEPEAIASPVHHVAPTGVAIFDATPTTIAWQPQGAANELVWLDRNGNAIGKVGEVDGYQQPAVSPDGRRVAVSVVDSKGGFADIWFYDLERGGRDLITRQTGQEVTPIWSPDGSRIAYAADREGPPHLYMMSLDDRDKEVRLVGPDLVQTPSDWSPDGKEILFSKRTATGASDIFLVTVSDKVVRAVIASDADERDAHFSPDGRWIAYTSNESGRAEVYLASLQNAKQRVRVSREGGTAPRWCGPEFCYVNEKGELLALPVRRGARPEFGEPRTIARLEGASSAETDDDYSYDRRSGRFLVNRARSGRLAVPVNVIVNWR
jgi:serine/threonine protein kinase